jgi:beta-lactamase class A
MRASDALLVRRDVLRGLGGAGLATLTLAPAVSWADSSFGGERFAEAVQAAEGQGGGRLGVAVLDTETGKRFPRRGEERFPVTSTFKFVLAGAVMEAVDRGRERLDRRIPIRDTAVSRNFSTSQKVLPSKGNLGWTV